jgi:hypothetical protein
VSYDLGDVVPVGLVTYNDSTGVAEDATSAVLTITLPDGTTTTPTVTHVALSGVYTVNYTSTLVGRHGVRWVVVGTATVLGGAHTDVFDVLDPAELPLVSLADLKKHLNVVSTTDDEELRYTLATATDLAERYTNRALRRKTVVETHDGGKTALLLRETPVLSVTTVVENLATLAATEYTINTNSGVLYRGAPISTGRAWYGGTQGVTVTYVAGYTSPPLVAQRGVMEIVRWMWQNSQQGPRSPFGADQGAGTDALPAWLMRPLDSLVVPGIA